MGKELPPFPEIPINAIHIFNAYCNLNELRTSNGFSLQPLQPTEYEAWQRLTGNILTNDENKILFGLFNVYDQAIVENQPKDPLEEQ